MGRADDVRADGIIPACAGSTKRSLDHEDHREDHPRMCGEHLTAVLLLNLPSGSSPHVRGAHRGRVAARLQAGIIPACAGSTPRPCSTPLLPRDHPRMCGEHSYRFVPMMMYGGSSPHVRGARRGEHVGQHRQGIIPACAGSTPVLAMRRAAAGDHPRMCGEHRLPHIEPSTLWGSSPHVRGAPYHVRRAWR